MIKMQPTIFYAGWDFAAGKSNNAVRADETVGIVKKSEITGTTAAYITAGVGVKITVKDLRRLIDTAVWPSAEWHHTGKYYQKTHYYDMDDLVEILAADPGVLEICRAGAKAAAEQGGGTGAGIIPRIYRQPPPPAILP